MISAAPIYPKTEKHLARDLIKNNHDVFIYEDCIKPVDPLNKSTKASYTILYLRI